MPREISDTSIELFTTLLNEKIALIESYNIPVGDKRFLKASYEKALEEIKNNNSSAAAELERIKRVREEKRREEEERNRTHIIPNPVATETVKEGNNLIVKSIDPTPPLDPRALAKIKILNLLKTYTKQQLELDWPHSWESTRPIYKGILFHAQTYSTAKEIYEAMYPSESSAKMTYANLFTFIKQLCARHYFEERTEKRSLLKLSPLGKAALEYADLKTLVAS